MEEPRIGQSAPSGIVEAYSESNSSVHSENLLSSEQHRNRQQVDAVYMRGTFNAPASTTEVERYSLGRSQDLNDIKLFRIAEGVQGDHFNELIGQMQI